MKTLTSLAGAVLVVLAVAAVAGAKPNSASVKLTSDAAGLVPTSTAVPGGTIYATFTVSGGTPIVPGEYSMENTCALKGGHFSEGSTTPIVYWTNTNDNNDSIATVPIYVGANVPSGASCRVDLVANTVVKGSTASYTVT